MQAKNALIMNFILYLFYFCIQQKKYSLSCGRKNLILLKNSIEMFFFKNVFIILNAWHKEQSKQTF